MKKFLAMLLSVSMVASMSAVSFAVSGSSRTLSGTPDKTTPADAYASMIKDGKYDDDDGYPIDTTLIGPFGYNSDDKNLTIDSVSRK